MDPNSVNAAVTFTPKAGMIDKIIEHASRFAMVLERKDPNVLMFSVAKTKSLEDPSAAEQVAVFMSFRDKAAEAAHMASPERMAFVQEAKQLDAVVGEPEIRSFTPVGGFAPRQ